MKVNDSIDQDLFEKITKGMELTFKRLLEEKRKNDCVFIFSKDGKIIKVKARDMKG